MARRSLAISVVAALALCGAVAATHAAQLVAYAPERFPVNRIFSTPDGVSHLETVLWTAADIDAFGQKGILHKLFGSPATKVTIVGGAPGFKTEPHNTGGARTLVYMLGGSSTAYFADGARKQFVQGDIILLENDQGPGTAVEFGPDGYLGLAIALPR